MNDWNSIGEQSAEILEPNLQFYRSDPKDQIRYFVGPEVLHALGWMASTIVVPILLSGATEIVKARVKEWLERHSSKEAIPPALPKELQAEIGKIVKTEVTDSYRSQAITSLTDYLSHRGWPKQFATDDAAQIVAAIEKSASSVDER
jgi:hypothetical protein